VLDFFKLLGRCETPHRAYMPEAKQTLTNSE
jgi:hypothetical protein